MNGQRIIRKYFAKLTDEDLHGLIQAAKDDVSNEAQCIKYLAISELEYRSGEHLKAIKKLGVTGDITTKRIAEDRIAIYNNEEYFGIWDTVRKTFVD